MPQFTKGRWVFPEGKTCISTFDSDGYIEKNIAEVYADMPIPEFEANARLIAEAPVMYELLNKTFHILGKNTANDAICREIDECLSRVDGIPSEHKYTPTLTAASVDMYNLLKEVQLWFHGENSAQVFILNDVKALLNSIDGKDEQ